MHATSSGSFTSGTGQDLGQRGRVGIGARLAVVLDELPVGADHRADPQAAGEVRLLGQGGVVAGGDAAEQRVEDLVGLGLADLADAVDRALDHALGQCAGGHTGRGERAAVLHPGQADGRGASLAGQVDHVDHHAVLDVGVGVDEHALGGHRAEAPGHFVEQDLGRSSACGSGRGRRRRRARSPAARRRRRAAEAGSRAWAPGPSRPSPRSGIGMLTIMMISTTSTMSISGVRFMSATGPPPPPSDAPMPTPCSPRSGSRSCCCRRARPSRRARRSTAGSGRP